MTSKRAIALGALSLILTSCGLPARTRSMFGGTLPVEVTVACDVNRQSPIAVDLLVVYERPVLDALKGLKAEDWFAQRNQLRRDHPGAFDLWSWEWVPGQAVKDQELHYAVGAKGSIVFADYLTPGSHRAVLDPHQPIRLMLGADDFVVGPRKGAATEGATGCASR